MAHQNNRAIYGMSLSIFTLMPDTQNIQYIILQFIMHFVTTDNGPTDFAGFITFDHLPTAWIEE